MPHPRHISVIIPTYKRSQRLKRTLDALASQQPKPYQVIIVNNCVDKVTDTVVSSFKKYLPIEYYHELRKGPSYARNLGYQFARGDIIAFLDDDCVPSDNWSYKILNTFKHNAYTQNIFQERCHHIFPNSNIITELFYFRYALDESYNKPVRSGQYNIISGAHAGCCFMNRSVLRMLTYVFDEKLFPFIGEEADFSIRVQLAGVTILKHPHVEVTHYKQPHYRMTNSFLNAFWKGRAMGIIHEKYFTQSHIAMLFSKEIKVVQRHEQFIFWNAIYIFLKLHPKKPFTWKLLAWFYETLRSAMLHIGYLYGIVWYRIYAKRLKTFHQRGTTSDMLHI